MTSNAGITAQKPEAIQWDTTTETIQTILTMLSPQTREYVLSEMRDVAPAEQAELVTAIAESDHIQDTW